jgi:hypothetical protein
MSQKENVPEESHLVKAFLPKITSIFEAHLMKSFCWGSRGTVFSKRVPLAAGGKK